MRTFVEKILNAPAGSIVIRRPDIVMSHDNSARIRKIFEEMGGEKLKDAGKLLVVLDRKMTGTTDELIELAKRNELDFVFTLDKKLNHPEWICASQTAEEIIFAAPKKQNFPAMSIEELVQKPFILTERGAAYRYELEQLLAEQELRIEPILEIGNTETIIKLLKRGMGYSFLPKCTVRQELENEELVQIQTDFPVVKMYCQLLYHKNKWLTPQMNAFIQLVKKTGTNPFTICPGSF